MPELRRVRPADASGIQDLLAGIFGEYGITFDLPGFDADMQDPAGSYNTPEKVLWVLADGATILGTVGVAIAGTEAELKRLYLSPTLRGQGWGGRLTQHAIEYARAAGCTRFVAWSDTLFTHAHRMYRQLGFTQEGKRPLEDLDQSWEYGFWMQL